MSSIFLAGIIIFCLSTGYFSVFHREKQFNTAFLVSALMAASYTLMYNDVLTTTNAAGESLYWSRWLVYALSCSLLMYSITHRLNFSGKKTAAVISLNVYVMLTGALASVLTGWGMLVVFGLSGLAYILQVTPILTHKDTQNVVKALILCGWGVFPIIFLLSPEGYSLISNEIAAGIYLCLDILTKIIYYFAVKKEA